MNTPFGRHLVAELLWCYRRLVQELLSTRHDSIPLFSAMKCSLHTLNLQECDETPRLHAHAKP
jgi:hypothetical protein